MLINVKLPTIVGFLTFMSIISTKKFSMLINVKMPTLVGILTFISMINTLPESLKAGNVFIFPHSSSYEQLNFIHEKMFLTSGPCIKIARYVEAKNRRHLMKITLLAPIIIYMFRDCVSFVTTI